MKIEQLYELYKKGGAVQTDTRKLQAGDLFFALKGPSFNGNEFAKKALDEGAAYAIVDEAQYVINEKTILVDDVLVQLQELAKYHRQQFSIPFLAITGSNGKTTTKELVHAVLSSTYKTYTTEGNLNNHIGIPLTLLKIKPDAEMAVIEMGANHIGEIAGYCRYALPTHGIITNCGKAHLEGFGSVEGVRKAKGELYDHLRAHHGVAFAMWDYDYLHTMSKGITVVSYGSITEADIIGKVAASDPFLEVEIVKGLPEKKFPTKLVGEYNLPNVLAAITVGNYFKVTGDRIQNAIENYQPSNSRSQLIKKGTNQIILDAYNANPSSMKLAIENFAKMPAPQKVLLLGAMAELGDSSLAEHRDLIDLISRSKWKAVALVGGDFLKIPHPYLQFNNSQEARVWFGQQHFEHSSILVKGSRSIQMEKIIND